MARKTIEQLRAMNLPHATADTVGFSVKTKDNTPEAREEKVQCLAAVNEYLHGFADTDGKCPQCGAQLTGLLGRFVWGIANGEGFCGECDYPCRAYHRNVDVIEFMTYVLPYHPDSLLTKEQRESQGAAVIS